MGSDSSPPSHPTLLYDGACRLCRALARLVRMAVPEDGLAVLPFQRPEGRRLLRGWTVERIHDAAHLVLPDGRVVSGAEALSGILDFLPLVGAVHRAMAARPWVRGLVAFLYDAGYALRDGTRCAQPTPSEPERVRHARSARP